MGKEHEKSGIITIKENVEKDLISSLVSVDVMKGITTAVLPFKFHSLDT